MRQKVEPADLGVQGHLYRRRQRSDESVDWLLAIGVPIIDSLHPSHDMTMPDEREIHF